MRPTGPDPHKRAGLRVGRRDFQTPAPGQGVGGPRPPSTKLLINSKMTKSDENDAKHKKRGDRKELVITHMKENGGDRFDAAYNDLKRKVKDDKAIVQACEKSTDSEKWTAIRDLMLKHDF